MLQPILAVALPLKAEGKEQPRAVGLSPHAVGHGVFSTGEDGVLIGIGPIDTLLKGHLVHPVGVGTVDSQPCDCTVIPKGLALLEQEQSLLVVRPLRVGSSTLCVQASTEVTLVHMVHVMAHKLAGHVEGALEVEAAADLLLPLDIDLAGLTLPLPQYLRIIVHVGEAGREFKLTQLRQNPKVLGICPQGLHRGQDVLVDLPCGGLHGIHCAVDCWHVGLLQQLEPVLTVECSEQGVLLPKEVHVVPAIIGGGPGTGRFHTGEDGGLRLFQGVIRLTDPDHSLRGDDDVCFIAPDIPLDDPACLNERLKDHIANAHLKMVSPCLPVVFHLVHGVDSDGAEVGHVGATLAGLIHYELELPLVLLLEGTDAEFMLDP